MDRWDGHRTATRLLRTPAARERPQARLPSCSVKAAGTALPVLAYLLAVVDGTMQDNGLYPSPPGRTGLARYTQRHPWIVAGAVSGIVGSILSRI